MRAGCVPLNLTGLAESECDVSFSWFGRSADLPASLWDSLVPHDRPFLNRSYLQVLDRGHADNLIYGMARSGQTALGAFLFHKVRLHGADLRGYAPDAEERLYRCPFAETLTRLARQRLHHLRWHLLFSGTPLAAQESGFAFHPDLDQPSRSALLDKALRQAARELGGIRGFLVSGPSPEMPGFYQVPAEPDMVMDLDPSWATLDDYLQALQSKYRVRAKRILREAEHLELRELDEAGLREGQERWHRLYLQVLERAGFNLATLAPDYFCSLKQSLGDTFRFWAWYRAGSPEPLAFHTAILRSGTLHAHFIGLDYQANEQFRIYPAMLYRYLQAALELGCRQLHLGRTAPEIKSALGASARNSVYQFRYGNPLVNRLLGLALLEARLPDWTPRHPFPRADGRAGPDTSAAPATAGPP